MPAPQPPTSDSPTLPSSPPGQALAGTREWFGLAVLSLPVLLVSMDMTVLHLAVPASTTDLQPTSSELLWIVDVYPFMVAGLLITMGGVGDRIGRRPLLLIGAAAFAAASVAAAFAPSATALIAARAALGIAGATLAPSTLALIRTMFCDPRQRSIATSVWVLSFLAGGPIGPIIGGVFLQTWWWGGVFLLGVPVMLVLLTAGPFLLPEYRNPGAGRIDLISASLSLASILGVVYLLKEVAGHGPSLPPVAVGGAGVLLGIVFIRRQRRLPDPLLDLRLLREPGFGVALTVLTIGSLVLAGSGFLTAQYLQLVLGLSPLYAGLWTLPPLAAGVVAIAASQSIGQRLAPRLRTGLGLAVAAAGLLLLTRTSTEGVEVAVVSLALLFAGFMPVLAAGVDVVTGVAPPDRAGAAAALSETAQELGGALGIAVLGSTATAVYRHQLRPLLADLPATAAEAADTLAVALQPNQPLPPPVVEVALTAFTTGLHAAAAVAAALVALSAVAVVTSNKAAPESGQDSSVPARRACRTRPGSSGCRPPTGRTCGWNRPSGARSS